MKTFWIILIILIALILLIIAGLKIKPISLPSYSGEAGSIEYAQLDTDLPAPVTRFYEIIYPNGIPQFESAVISGKVDLRINGIKLNGRFRFTHIAGQGYRHYIETTFFGLPIMKINEHYLDGHGRLELPFGVSEGYYVDQGANLGLWAESIWLPAILLTDQRVRWESKSDISANLIVPFGNEEQIIEVYFDPQTDMIDHMESMRYKDSEEAGKILWTNTAHEWQNFDGFLNLYLGSLIWGDEDKPWAVFTVEEVIYNSDVAEYVQAVGP